MTMRGGCKVFGSSWRFEEIVEQELVLTPLIIAPSTLSEMRATPDVPVLFLQGPFVWTWTWTLTLPRTSQ
jgi:hypothetical protein